MSALDALDAMIEARKGFYSGVVSLEDARAKAEAYRASLAELKASDPARFKHLSIPSVAKLMRG